jgi:carboxymethylenebutenolidase
VQEKEIRVQTADGEMTTFVGRPDGQGPYPVAVVFMDGMGYREQVKVNARRFAQGGFFVVAPDLYYRAGEKLSFDWARMREEPGYREELMEVLTAVTPDRAVSDIEAVLDAIDDDPAAAAGPKVCVGYCMGARLALHAAAVLPEMAAASGIHAGGVVTDQPDSPHHDLAAVRGELYFGFAEDDASAPPEMIDRFREAMAEHGVEGTVERLVGTQHGYAMADLPVYQQAGAERHFDRTLDLWRRALSQEPVEA